MGNGEWGMGNGKWGMGNGEWGMGNGETSAPSLFRQSLMGETPKTALACAVRGLSALRSQCVAGVESCCSTWRATGEPEGVMGNG